MQTKDPKAQHTNFIRNIIQEDLSQGKFQDGLVTRFPPEPNGHLHIGHAKSICLNFGISQDFDKSYCNLRFDDTNPSREDEQYYESIKEDVSWLGFRWKDPIRYASDYFEQLYHFACQLIRQEKAYVCQLSPEMLRETRGTLTEPGQESPYRNRSVEENLRLFEAMRRGEFEEGSHLLRAKIDMASGNINMRDPVIYRILKVHHPRSKDKWCIYPMYDFTHCLSDSLENITHSLCTLEFQDHRPLYDWYIEQLDTPSQPRQIEFSRLNLAGTVTSKRKLKQLIDDKAVDSWDDPRLPTIKGLRRRGYTAKSIRMFCERIGVSKKDSEIDSSILEDCLREDLNENAPRAMLVKNPLLVRITTLKDEESLSIEAPRHPQKPEMGKRTISFSNQIYIEQEDFCENPPPKFHRLKEGSEVRLRNAFVIRCDKIIKDDKTGEILELICSHDPKTLGKKPEGRKVKGIIHWVDAKNCSKVELRLFSPLFCLEASGKVEEKTNDLILNPNSKKKITEARAEASLLQAKKEQSFQFERLGYFCLDKESTKKNLIFNQSVSLREGSR